MPHHHNTGRHTRAGPQKPATSAGRCVERRVQSVLDRPLLPANQADRCTTRHALDEEVLCEALGLPDEILDPLSTLRQQWCREPSNQ